MCWFITWMLIMALLLLFLMGQANEHRYQRIREAELKKREEK